MSGRRILLGLAGVALLVGAAVEAQAQRSPYGVEEYNSYVDTTRAQDPAARLQAIEAFLQKYPQSVLRAFIYPNQAQTAFALQRYPKVIEAVDGFLEMERDQVATLYKQSQYNDTQIDGAYYQALILYTYSFLQSFRNGTPQADALAARAAERARQGLELHDHLYAQVPPPADEAGRKKFQEQKSQEEASFHKVLAFTAWRKKDFPEAAREYAILLKHTPDDAWINYQLGLASLQKSSPEYTGGVWHVARAIALGVPKANDVKEYLTKVMSGYQQAVPQCIQGQVEELISRAGRSVQPPAGWKLIDGDRVNAVRQEMSVQRIFDDLRAGGETTQVMWLASCGTEIGLGEGGQPELAVMILEVTEAGDNLVTLRVAAGQEAVDAKIANVEVKVEGPPEAKKLKAEDVVRVSGKISDFQSDPQFLVRLTGGRVNPEDLPKEAAPARRRSGAGGR